MSSSFYRSITEDYGRGVSHTTSAVAPTEDVEERMRHVQQANRHLQSLNVEVYVYVHPSCPDESHASFPRDVERILTQLPSKRDIRCYIDTKPFKCMTVRQMVGSLEIKSIELAADQLEEAPRAPALNPDEDPQTRVNIIIGLVPTGVIRRWTANKRVTVPAGHEHINVTSFVRRSCAIDYECYTGRDDRAHVAWNDVGLYDAYVVNHEVMHALGFMHLCENWREWQRRMLEKLSRTRTPELVCPVMFQHTFEEDPTLTPLPFPSYWDLWLQSSLERISGPSSAARPTTTRSSATRSR